MAALKQATASFFKCPFLKGSSGGSVQAVMADPVQLAKLTALCPHFAKMASAAPPSDAAVPASHAAMSAGCPFASKTPGAVPCGALTGDPCVNHAEAPETPPAALSPSPPKFDAAYDSVFESHVAKIKEEGRYRIFADLERKAGSFPVADCHDSRTGSVSPSWGGVPTTTSGWVSTRRCWAP